MPPTGHPAQDGGNRQRTLRLGHRPVGQDRLAQLSRDLGRDFQFLHDDVVGLARVVVDVEIQQLRTDSEEHVIAFRRGRVMPRACRIEQQALFPVDHQRGMSARARPVRDHRVKRDGRRTGRLESRARHGFVRGPDRLGSASRQAEQ